jgi:hypothetical protein
MDVFHENLLCYSLIIFTDCLGTNIVHDSLILAWLLIIHGLISVPSVYFNFENDENFSNLCHPVSTKTLVMAEACRFKSFLIFFRKSVFHWEAIYVKFRIFHKLSRVVC